MYSTQQWYEIIVAAMTAVFGLFFTKRHSDQGEEAQE